LKKLILASAPGPDGIVRLVDKDYHYLANVRRILPGARLLAELPDGTEAELLVCSIADNAIIAQCSSPQPSVHSPIVPIILFQAMLKGTKMDLIVRQAVESGVLEIVPFESEYSTVRLKPSHKQDKSEPGDKLQRWQRIVREARQQSGSSISTIVKPPLGFDGLLDYWEGLKKETGGTGILLHHEMLGSPLAQGTFHDYLSNVPLFVVLAVGPEGGFSSSEASRFLSTGFMPIKMGDTILKAETAALYGTAAVRTILLERASWLPRKSESH
jgi:16S rRNA (uracil1498-N3)-methyltransferase